jgi:uncharacterized protein YqeY
MEVRGSSEGVHHDATRKELIVARFLDNPDVKAAKSVDEAFKVLKRVEAAESFREGGREDAALKEEAELAMIDAYLPAQLAPEELAELIAAAIAEAGATEPKDLGSVMKILQPKTAGRADGKAVSTAVREALGA